MKKSVALLMLLLFVIIGTRAQDLSAYEKHWMVQSGDTLPFRLLLPENYDPGKKYPLVLFLHGRGESGDDNEKQLTHGARFFLIDSIRKKYPAFVVFPQCAVNSYWSNVVINTRLSKTGKRSFYFLPGGEASQSMGLAMVLVDHLLENYKIEKKQVYAMGLSMGGMGTFEIVRRMPGIFTAGIPICGGANPATASKLKNVKWWVFHGGKDDVVLPSFSQKIVNALRNVKAQVKFTLYPEANHNSWDPAFAEPGLMQWLFAQRK
jgi:predicted peptidase